MFKKISYFSRLLYEIVNLPRVEFMFDRNLMEDPQVRNSYDYFNKSHQRIKFVKNKQIGVAFINLMDFSLPENYFSSINGKNSAYYYSRKCHRRGYALEKIDRNKFSNDIALIENSAPMRQGKVMSADYGQSDRVYFDHAHYKYFGVTLDGKLVAYCNVGFYGNFACISRLLGHADHLNDGVMYFMILEIVADLIREKAVRYIFYDTWYGASLGLKQFKRKLGFAPCIAKWIIRDLNEVVV